MQIVFSDFLLKDVSIVFPSWYCTPPASQKWDPREMKKTLLLSNFHSIADIAISPNLGDTL